MPIQSPDPDIAAFLLSLEPMRQETQRQLEELERRRAERRANNNPKE
jgi:predicted phosphoribosyltransferase